LIMAAALDPFIPNPQVRERFHVFVEAPPVVVMEVAEEFDVQSLRVVRGIFRARERLMRSSPQAPRQPKGLRAEMLELGWAVLTERRGELLVCGATCQPWQADVRFRPLGAAEFATFSEPDQVKIAWTLEAQAEGKVRTRFVHETRAIGTDAGAREKFRRYWRWARFGIIGIRLVLLPAIRRGAEKQWQASVA
jgi:hypothetical protein